MQEDKSDLSEEQLKSDTVTLLEYNWIKQYLKEEMEHYKECTISSQLREKHSLFGRTKSKLENSQRYKQVIKFE